MILSVNRVIVPVKDVKRALFSQHPYETANEPQTKLWLPLVLQYATDYKMVAAGNDSNGTILYQKVGGTVPPHLREQEQAPFYPQ